MVNSAVADDEPTSYGSLKNAMRQAPGSRRVLTGLSPPTTGAPTPIAPGAPTPLPPTPLQPTPSSVARSTARADDAASAASSPLKPSASAPFLATPDGSPPAFLSTPIRRRRPSPYRNGPAAAFAAAPSPLGAPAPNAAALSAVSPLAAGTTPKLVTAASPPPLLGRPPPLQVEAARAGAAGPRSAAPLSVKFDPAFPPSARPSGLLQLPPNSPAPSEGGGLASGGGLGRHGLPTSLQQLPSSASAIALPTCGQPMCSRPNFSALPSSLPSAIPSAMPTAHNANAMQRQPAKAADPAAAASDATLSLPTTFENQSVTAIVVESPETAAQNGADLGGLPPPLRFVTSDDAGGMCSWRVSLVTNSGGDVTVAGPPLAPTYRIEMVKRWRGAAEERDKSAAPGAGSVRDIALIAARPLDALVPATADLAATSSSFASAATAAPPTVPLVSIAACANGTLTAWAADSGARLGLMASSGVTAARPSTAAESEPGGGAAPAPAPAPAPPTAVTIPGAPGTWHEGAYHWQLPLRARMDGTLAESVEQLADGLRSFLAPPR